ncbi:MAG: hypothetical protein HC810_02730 [Acaryochloridaceae cyanobacterium RL_2_7]|nr:hypothetical protein [Acaryochloridaceae cyanobacterium RL_2_7]
MMHYDPKSKRIGSYLIDAGLVTPNQIDVALNDQKSTGMRLGEVLVMRGWVKEKTMKFMINKVIDIERGIGQPLNRSYIETQRFRRQKPS